ncbi:MAG TPA: hypothetical protein VG604_00200, partial [Candidatus Saccharimonadales bacterium]|nr:hypothetical protein [Candidatus Saccharimonadales bacterium]
MVEQDPERLPITLDFVNDAGEVVDSRVLGQAISDGTVDGELLQFKAHESLMTEWDEMAAKEASKHNTASGGTPDYDVVDVPPTPTRVNAQHQRSEEWMGRAVVGETLATEEPKPKPKDPEQRSRQELLDDFYNAWELPPGLEAKHRREFAGMVDQLATQSLSPKQVERIRIAGDAIGWRMFAKLGEPLPKGLIVCGHINSPEELVVVDDWRLLGRFDTRSVTDALNTMSLRSIAEQRHAHRRIFNNRALYEATGNLIAASPQYALLKSFDNNRPASEVRPLTDFEKRIQAAQIEHEARRHFGLRPDQSFSAEPNAKKQVERSVLQLDDTEILARGKVETDPTKRAEAYFKKLFDDHLVANKNDRLKEIEPYANGFRLVGTSDEMYPYDANGIRWL